MFNLQQFIADHVICRPTSMFAADIEANKETLQAEIRNEEGQRSAKMDRRLP